MKSILLIATFTLLAGLGDAKGFLYAAEVWRDEHFNWGPALKSAAGFQFGAVMYWLALRCLTARGVVAVEIQTLFWFVATMIGIGLLTGNIYRWPRIDQAAAGAVLMGVAWLLYRTAH